MYSIQETIASTYRDRSSRFYGFLFPCETESQFTEVLNQYKSEYPDANHHCYAYRFDPHNPIDFSSDDGEPSGTAGMPILNQLRSQELINAGLIVVRYFGGTKLGKAGLIEAYGHTAHLCLEEASLLNIVPVQFFTITYSYKLENVIKKLMMDYRLSEEGAEYLSDIKKVVACPKENSKQFEKELSALAHLDIKFEPGEDSYITSL